MGGVHFNRFFSHIIGADKATLHTWLANELAMHPPYAAIFGHGPMVQVEHHKARSNVTDKHDKCHALMN